MNKPSRVFPFRLAAQFWSNVALFALPAMAITVPSGSAYPAALLAIAGLGGLFFSRDAKTLPASARWMFLYFLPLALCWLADDVSSGLGGRGFEKPLKIALTLPALWYLARNPPAHPWLWLGVGAGALLACLEAIYQFFFLHVDRAYGAMFSIHFGDLSVMLGLMGLCAWNLPVRNRWIFRSWLLLTCVAGLLASVLSGTRGAWLTLGVVVIAYLAYMVASRQYRLLLAVLAAITLLSGVATMLPSLRVLDRVHTAVTEVKAFDASRQANTSVGARLQMWQQAWHLYRQKPLLGWQHDGYLAQQKQAIANKQLDPAMAEFDHPHNELLNAAAKQGTIGVLALLLAYIGPALLFLRWFRASPHHRELRAVCAAGMLVPLAHAGFGLTETYLPHNSVATTYFFLLCLLWGTAWGLRRTNSLPPAGVQAS